MDPRGGGQEQDPATSHGGQPSSSSSPEQEHPVQDAHGGSMAPGLVDDVGRPVTDQPDQTDVPQP